ncbi:Myb protein J [Phytophthora cinnamomi]|uniref:Myb protein J n=1 Tax=Phytophthora cinnamomi TaxID=4785 RepID=UPI003559495E|nr:Myb protein J [Phytophthora cinnamomi]
MPPTDSADLSSSGGKKSKRPKPRSRFHLSRLRLRPKKTALQLEDFDDVRYKMEIVRLGDDASDSVDERVAFMESIFLALLCLLLLGGCVAVGFAAHLIEYSREVLRWLLPMLLLPLAWVVALVVWERRAIAMQSKIATQ